MTTTLSPTAAMADVPFDPAPVDPAPVDPLGPVDYADRSVAPATTRPMPPLVHDEPAGYRWAWLAVGLAVSALFAVVVFRFYAPADSGVDQNAYLVGGRLIAEHGTPKYVLPNPYAFTGGMMVRMPTGVYYPKYPFGLPLLYAAFFWLFGPERGPVWAFAVSPASAVAAVLGTFLLARAVAGSFAGVMAAVLLGTSQVMLSLADNPNSHAACTAVIVWGMYLLVRWWTTGSVWQGALAGFLIGYAFTIRYTEGLLVLPVAVACLTRVRWRHWSPWAMSAVVGAFALAFYLFVGLWTAGEADGLRGVHYWFSPGRSAHSAAMLALYAAGGGGLTALAFAAARGWLPRAWWTSFLRNVVPGLAWCVPVAALVVFNSATMRHAAGYDTTHESELGVAFQWKFLVKNWEMVVRTFDDLELFFVVPFAVAGLALVFRRSWRVGLLLLSWLVPGVLLYTSYYWSMDFDVAYARFYLTFLPALCVAAAVAFHDGLLGGRVGGTGPAIARGAVRHWAPVAQVLAAAAVVAALVLVLQPHVGTTRLATAAGLTVAAAGVVAALAVVARPTGTAWAALAARAPATVAVGLVVAVAAGVSAFRSLHGLRDGNVSLIPVIENYRTRLNLARVGQELLDHVPARSVVFAQAGGGIQSSTNYIQFLRDWDLYSADTFTEDGARKGFGGGGRTRRPTNANGRGGPGGGGPNGGGFMGFGGRGGPPGGGGPGGPGGGPPGMAGGNTDDQDVATATPIQPEQQDFRAGLYRGKNSRQLYQLWAAALHKSFAAHQRVFAVVDKDGLDTFKENLGTARYTYKPVSAWTDVALPTNPDEAAAAADDRSNRWGGGNRGGRRGGGNMGGPGIARLFGLSGQLNEWRLVEVLPK